jgi:hypothetical protein
MEFPKPTIYQLGFSLTENQDHPHHCTDPEVVAHACNPSYSGGRDQVDRDSRPA